MTGLPPPSTTKVGLTAVGGYQAEFHIYVCGLDLEAKAEWVERQIRYSAGDAVKELSCFKFSLNGYCPDNPRNQDVATCDLRVFVQTQNKGLVSKASLDVPGFNRWCMDNVSTTICRPILPGSRREISSNASIRAFKAVQAGHWATTSANQKARYTTNTTLHCSPSPPFHTAPSCRMRTIVPSTSRRSQTSATTLAISPATRPKTP